MVFTFRSLLLQKPTVRQPFLEAFDPFADGLCVVRPQAKAVARPGVDVQFGGHFELLELEIDASQAFRDVGPVVVAAGQEHRRRIRGGFNPARTARINERLKSRQRRQAIYRINRIGNGLIETLCGEEGHFATGGKTHHADAVGGDAPSGGAAAHEAEGALHVGERVVVHGVGGVGLLREAILEDKRRNAVFGPCRRINR